MVSPMESRSATSLAGIASVVRTCGRRLAWAAALAGIAGLASAAQKARSGPLDTRRVPPNVLVIVLDDVGADKLELYESGAGTVTPRIALLAEQGIQFTNYYTNPMCSTSRACLQTGRYAFRTGLGSILDQGAACPDSSYPSCALPLGECYLAPPCPPPSCPQDCCFKLGADEVFLPSLLRQGLAPNGAYRSAAFGKWHLSYPGNLPGLDSHPVDSGYDRYSGSIGNPEPEQHHYYWRKVVQAAGSNPTSTTVGSPDNTASADWSASVAREDAVGWINAQTRPFFAYVAFSPPHTPLQVPPLALLSPATRTALDELTPGGATTPPSPGDQGHQARDAQQRSLYYRAMLEAVDTEIGHLLDQIEAQKRANTMVFVVSDNGTQPIVIDAPHDPEHGKGSVYQLGVRVPMIVSGPLVPPVPAGYPLPRWHCDEMVGTVDLWRTIVEIGGASESLAFSRLGLASAPQIDSVSFLPLIRNPAATGTRQLAFSQIFLRNGRTIECLNGHARAASDKEYRYIRRQDQKPQGADCDLPLCSPAWVRTYKQEFYRVSDTEEPLSSNLVDPVTGVLLIPPSHPDYAEQQLHLDWLRSQMIQLSGD